MSKGVYVPADPQFPKHFHGIGIRIEDEVVIGAEHPVVLSANAPKEVCRSRAHSFFFTIILFCSFLLVLLRLFRIQFG
jgi:hypothetical protein